MFVIEFELLFFKILEINCIICFLFLMFVFKVFLVKFLCFNLCFEVALIEFVLFM